MTSIVLKALNETYSKFYMEFMKLKLNLSNFKLNSHNISVKLDI